MGNGEGGGGDGGGGEGEGGGGGGKAGSQWLGGLSAGVESRLGRGTAPEEASVASCGAPKAALPCEHALGTVSPLPVRRVRCEDSAEVTFVYRCAAPKECEADFG